MRNIVMRVLLALSVVRGIASKASADPSEPFGTRTAPEQRSSPN